MKKLFMIILVTVSNQVFPQWQNTWTSPSISYEKLSGWFSFERNGNDWKMRLYSLDSLQFNVMQEGYSFTPQYTYLFNDAERLAGLQFYSLTEDLTGDGYTEFYALSYYGTSPYRQSFKIVDITSGNILFERNDPLYYYSYPVLADVNNDGIVECIVSRYDYPSFLSYSLEVYSTGLTTSGDNKTPVKFEMRQNFPNPFNPVTTIIYSLNEAANVNVEVFDILGKKIVTLESGYREAGEHSVLWNGTDQSGNKQPTGVYFYRIIASGSSSVKKMLMLK